MSKFKNSEGYQIISDWMHSNGNEAFQFQEKTWAKFSTGHSGMVVAPTGYGKTFSVFLAVLIDYLNHPKKYAGKGIKLIWVSPLRSLAKDLQRAMQEVINEVGLDWVVETRNGDTPAKIKQRQARSMPEILIVTPETLHLLFAMKNHQRFFKNIQCIAIDEWHELLGSKRGVLTELAISYLQKFNTQLKIWGITATIGNLEEAMEVLIPYDIKKISIQTRLKKKTEIETVFPDEIEVLPWAGHLGSKMVDKILPIINQAETALIFTNTRSQSEMWYQLFLAGDPSLAGLIAIHHGSIDKNLREWIEDNLSSGRLKAVIATSSLDLGVDFKPVDTVIQIGSVKGVARFLQRAGRSGHSPFETSKIYFIPTHSLELIEISAIKEAVKQKVIEVRSPMVLTYDVLIQFLVTLAVGDGYREDEIREIVERTYAFKLLNEEDWAWAFNFITQGGPALKRYEEYHKVEVQEDGLYKVTNRRIALLHRMNMGVIVSDVLMKVKFRSGGYIGMVEEYFISKMKIGDKFILAGRTLELLNIKDTIAYVKSSSGKAITPSWLGGRLPLSSDLSHFMRTKLADALQPTPKEKELKFLNPLLIRQDERSHIPKSDEFLVEMTKTRDGHHLFMYPFEGRLVHEIFASIIAYRISLIKPISFTIAMNDYGFELLSDQEIPLDEENLFKILSLDNLMQDAVASVNATEMASRKFRDIAVISGLVLQNYYGKSKNYKSLQSSSGLIFMVLEDYDPNNLLLKQAYTEVFDQQFEEVRLKKAFNRIAHSKLIFKRGTAFTPLSFPIKVDSLRASMSNEDLVKRIEKMQKLK
ncbi:ligase-associated DNA damage response DEXH box helicase [Vaginella massiliensis]|uniref:ligase-associated DNA damage response DEXH box helicase n=1 Tax=Vaginella massiliensis TaxID=1816680 RepID=UPI003750D392